MKTLGDDQLEADLRAALDDGDVAKAALLSAEVDRRQQDNSTSLHSAALWYASVGLRVFPLSPASKIPFKGSRGCKEASDDPARIDAWWTATPDANIGIATGHLVDVVDIDGPEGQRSRAQLWDSTFERIDADNLGKVLTPRPGGMHIYVPATGDGNRAGIAPGVDYRGVGGYVVAPPSRTEVGTYRWLGTPTLNGQVAA